MRTLRPTTHGRVAAVLIIATSATLLLTGCQDSPDPVASSVPRAHPSATSSSVPQSSSEPAATPTPVTMTCDQVLTAEQLGKLLPPLTAVADFAPAEGTDAATAVADAGVACGYRNPSSGNTVAVSIARPTDADLTSLKNKAIRSSNVVPTYGVPPKVMGYFDVDSTSGVAEVFTGDYWVVAESKDFHEPGDASLIMSDVIGNLP